MIGLYYRPTFSVIPARINLGLKSNSRPLGIIHSHFFVCFLGFQQKTVKHHGSKAGRAESVHLFSLGFLGMIHLRFSTRRPWTERRLRFAFLPIPGNQI